MSVGSSARTVAELAELCGAKVEGDASRRVEGPASLADAGPTDVSFLAQPKYAPQLATTRAAAVLVGEDVEVARDDLSILRCANPELAFSQVVVAFAPPIPELEPGVHPTAVVHPSATVAPEARVGPHVTIEENATVAAGVRIHAGVVIGGHASVGEGSVLYPNVVLYPHVSIGARCIVHAGTVLGSDGFGFQPTKEGWIKTPQVGRVVIEDDVELGSNVSIDCARFGETRIGRGTKVDNLVHVAHNVCVGSDTLLLAQVGIAGSSTVGNQAILAGQVGIIGHLHIGDRAKIFAGSGVTKDVPDDDEWFGAPAGPARERMKKMRAAERAGDQVRKVSRKVSALEEQLDALKAELDRLKGGGGSDEA